MNPEIKSIHTPARTGEPPGPSLDRKLPLSGIVRGPDGTMVVTVGEGFVPISLTDRVSRAGTVRFD